MTTAELKKRLEKLQATLKGDADFHDMMRAKAEKLQSMSMADTHRAKSFQAGRSLRDLENAFSEFLTSSFS